ncbi:MAG: hypothetical protein H0T42_08005 [Deltaproteobacteria bacterium]|nr:hypothetical protein [Deltaproteobacteria bacterium]
MTRLEELFAPRIAVIVPDAIGSALAADLRARFERTGYTRYTLLDRGSYDELRDPGELEPMAALIAVTTEITERSLVLAEARVLQLVPGDYLLAHHDRVHDEHHIELILDLSPALVPNAAVHYRRDGDVYFEVPSRPCALSIVAREPSVTCNHVYVSKLHLDARVVRLVLLLRDA